MARSKGRLLKIQRGSGSPLSYTTIAAVRTKTFTVGREGVDVSTDDDTGYRALLAEPAQRQIEITFSGMAEDDVFLALAANEASPPVLEDIRILLPSGATIDGKFVLASYAETGEYNNAVTFEGTLQSANQWTYTAAS